MRADLHRRVQRYGWDRAAESYAAFWEPLLLRCSERAVAIVDPHPGERALDVASGAGAAALLLAERVGLQGAVLGTDLSEQMVRLAAKRAAAHGLAHTRFARMDAERLKLPDGSQDLATCVLGLMYPPDPDAALRELARVLRPGGRSVAVVWGRRDRCGWREAFPIVDARVRSEVCPLFFALGAEGALAAAMRRAGFTVRHEERTTEILRFASGAAACEAMFAGGPAALAYSRFDEATRAAVRAEYLAGLAPYRDGEAYDVPGEFVYVLGVRS
jgi:ubiquinone/menaquinone biosynthesis C-methylase UbiE